MRIRHLLAAAAILAVPVTATATATAAAPTRPARPAAKAPAKPEMDPVQAMAMMTKVFDKLFPAGPEPDPARLAAARSLSFRTFPKGAYAEAMNGFVDGMADRVLAMSEKDFADMVPPTPPKKGQKAKEPSTLPLREMLSAKDPQFDAKLAAGKAFAKTMFVKFGDVMEPKFREGMARSMARKFDAKQMAEIDAFLATPTGALYGRQMLGMWFEPDVMRSTFSAFPEMIKLMPDLMKDAAAFDQAMKGDGAAKK
ncbi:hypothetical protein [Sphingomonas astaxanthinifaciens]|uniref:DUF2059 domain-containing protein n=1 Tax=Sphingomonas astaxanthinifaciens DSM 22298 TaxID=1123267 RepID=A0ABQ5Z9A4_9SPHN|nr:hypothetical protein [Sphingomonas astaxanthinifaciens]GLR47167.1 hypothetical protein GCM10007925_08780 [Sphingomonas astaxanthinifaciens DSM 22298]